MSKQVPKLKNRGLRVTIVAGVITSVIVILFVEPLLKLAWAGILLLGPRFYQGYVDSIYKDAALGHRNFAAVVLLQGFIYLLTMTALGLIIVQSVKSRLLRRVASKSKERRKSPSAFPRRRLLAVQALCVLGMCVTAIPLITRPYVDLQLNASFQQRLKVLAPIVSELDIRELEADWASMRSRQDYEGIVARMASIALEKGVVLPPLLLK